MAVDFEFKDKTGHVIVRGCLRTNSNELSFSSKFEIQYLDMLDKELWVNKSWGDRAVVKINDANIREEDLYYLGFLKVIRIDKVETFVNVTKLY